MSTQHLPADPFEIDCPSEQRLAGDLVAVDPASHEFRVPHCARCGDPVALSQAYRRPGPFCDSCIEDVFASAQSYGGEIGELATRFNARLESLYEASLQAGNKEQGTRNKGRAKR